LEAIELCRKNSDISIVLMDIQLPEMNGYDATRIIKSENKNIPVIAQTAYATHSDFEAAIDAGCVDILVKPINKKELLKKIAERIL
jgi:CheY-like chemotaxis protein